MEAYLTDEDAVDAFWEIIYAQKKKKKKGE